MSVPYDYVELSNSMETWRVSTTFLGQRSSTRNNMLCVSSSGLMTHGENDSQSMERTYSSGSVLPPEPRFIGKNFSLEFLLFSLNDKTVNIKQIFQFFQEFLVSGTVTLKTDFPHNLTCQVQRIEITQQDWVGTGRMKFTVYFKASQP